MGGGVNGIGPGVSKGARPAWPPTPWMAPPYNNSSGLGGYGASGQQPSWEGTTKQACKSSLILLPLVINYAKSSSYCADSAALQKEQHPGREQQSRHASPPLFCKHLLHRKFQLLRRCCIPSKGAASWEGTNVREWTGESEQALHLRNGIGVQSNLNPACCFQSFELRPSRGWIEPICQRY
eukprot:1150813-Pelagomonas_calceolata.AAC.6